MNKTGGRSFLAKAVVILAQALKSRDADHPDNLVYDRKDIDEEALTAGMVEARDKHEAIPEYDSDADTPTGAGRQVGGMGN